MFYLLEKNNGFICIKMSSPDKGVKYSFAIKVRDGLTDIGILSPYSKEGNNFSKKLATIYFVQYRFFLYIIFLDRILELKKIIVFKLNQFRISLDVPDF